MKAPRPAPLSLITLGPVIRSGWFMAVFPALLAVLFSFWNLHHFSPAGFFREFQLFDRGGFFLAGVPTGDAGTSVTFNMPLFEIVVAAARHLGATAGEIFVILHLGVYSLVFLAGCLLNGYWAGIIALAACGLIGVEREIIYEQTFYSFFLLLTLIFLLLKSRENTLKNNLFCGLAVGASLLVRTPLFLFPPLAVLFEGVYRRERSRAFMLRSLVFLSASYVLLLPWGFLNNSLNGKFDIFDTGRAACNTITAAEGSVFTMEGDCRKAAGLAPRESAIGFYLRDWGKAPLFHARTVFRRLRAIFLFYPLLFIFFMAAGALGRWRDKPLLLCLPVYFILIHSLLSVEMRYFYPMRYLLVPLIAGGLLSRFPRSGSAPCGYAARGAAAAFWLSFCLVLGAEALIAAYPFRAARTGKTDDVYAQASSRFPRDSVLHGLKCRELWGKGDDAGFRECLAARIPGFEDIPGAYFLAVSSSIFPSSVALPAADLRDKVLLQCLIVRMLRECELGQRGPAAGSFREAYAVFERTLNRLQGNGEPVAEPYDQDRRLAARIRLDSARFWDSFVYDMLLFWPPQRMPVILSRLGEAEPLSGRLKTLSEELAQELGTGKYDERSFRTALLRTGPVLAAGKGPGAASRVELLRQCRNLAAENKKEQALQACLEAAYGPAGRSSQEPGSALAACDASLESYKLLKDMGRNEEAREMLLWAVKNAPPGWAGLPEARRELGVK